MIAYFQKFVFEVAQITVTNFLNKIQQNKNQI